MSNKHTESTDEGESSRGERIRFIPEVTAGNMLSVLSMCAMITTVWFGFDKKLALFDQIQHRMQQDMEANRRVTETLAENQQMMIRTQDKFAMYLEELKPKR